MSSPCCQSLVYAAGAGVRISADNDDAWLEQPSLHGNDMADALASRIDAHAQLFACPSCPERKLICREPRSLMALGRATRGPPPHAHRARLPRVVRVHSRRAWDARVRDRNRLRREWV
jgi:hypothetical protein